MGQQAGETVSRYDLPPKVVAAGAGVLIDMIGDDFSQFDRARAVFLAMSEELEAHQRHEPA